MLTKPARRLTAEGVARTLATGLTQWGCGTATGLAEDLLEGWPLVIRVREREERKLGLRDASRLDSRMARASPATGARARPFLLPARMSPWSWRTQNRRC